MFEDRTFLDNRLRWWRYIILASMVLLLSGLAYFQIFRSDNYVKLATSNKLRVVRLPATRGRILDSNGIELATNVLTFDLMGYPQDLLRDGTTKSIAEVFSRHGIPLDVGKIEKIIKKQYWAPYRWVFLVRNLTLAQVTDLLSDVDFPPQVFHIPVWRRTYPAGGLLCHAVGYVGAIAESELKRLSKEGDRSRYVGGDIVGKGGIERFYEDRLQGYPGHRIIEVDARGRLVKVLSRYKSVPGEDLHLTLDVGAQRLAAKLLGDRRGAVIAMDVSTGGIKALYSSPIFDVNPLAWGVSSREWSQLVNDPARPMMNRATGGAYSPGSVYKPVVAYAALNKAVISASTQFTCTGSFKLGKQIFRCHRRWGHGKENLVEALRDSCDVYFYQTGLLAGIDELIKWGTRFGLGKKTGIDLPDEVSGTIAGKEWKLKRIKERWYHGDTVNYSIGQGYLLVTPIQLLNLYSSLATGVKVTPHLLQDKSSRQIDLKLNKKYMKQIREGLKAVVSPKGTGRLAGHFGVSVAGKSGTVQNPQGDDHAVFAAYAPADNPRFAVIVFIEAGLHGGSVAGPIAGEVLAYLVKHDKGGL